MNDTLKNRRVQVYWNRPLRRWSIRDKRTRRVIHHAGDCRLMDCQMHVSQTGVQRCRRLKRRSVVAWVEGSLQNVDEWFGREQQCAKTAKHVFNDRLYFNVMKTRLFRGFYSKRPVRKAKFMQFCTMPDAGRGEAWFMN